MELTNRETSAAGGIITHEQEQEHCIVSSEAADAASTLIYSNVEGKYHREKSFTKLKERDSIKRRSTDLGPRPKPAQALYRPPPVSAVSAAGSSCSANSLNPSAKEFAPIAPSKSFDAGGSKLLHDNINLNRTGLTITVPGRQAIFKSRSISSNQSLDRSISDYRINANPLSISASSGGDRPDIHLQRPPLEQQQPPMVDLHLFSFPLEVVNMLHRALDDPNRVPGRSLMELVKQILNRVISAGGGRYSTRESQKIPEQGSIICMSIIEREEKETFLESLINTCQELYHDRERLLRNDVNRWNAYISFLNEMYAALKRKQLHFLTKYSGVAPKLVLLSLLAECCTATLTSCLQSLQEVETMFLVLTHIGKDLEAETPGRMSLLVTCLREAFLTPHVSPQISKKLLQLIELRAADWNLPAQAVMYYYPGGSSL